MKRRFNTAGPCIPGKHYMLPALDRLPEIRELVAGEQYFVIHAPRQTGKTTTLRILCRELNDSGQTAAVYCSLEALQGMEDPAEALLAIRDLLFTNYLAGEGDAEAPSESLLRETSPERYGRATIIRSTLSDLSRRAGKPLAVFFDEADCLCGRALIAFLRQLRDGYVNRDMIPFPASIALVGMLDVRDYKAQIRPDGESLGQVSPFNIISEDLFLRNFTEAEVRALYAQHTEDTGQPFAPGAVEAVMDWTDGQPWLVNASPANASRKSTSPAAPPPSPPKTSKPRKRPSSADATPTSTVSWSACASHESGVSSNRSSSAAGRRACR